MKKFFAFAACAVLLAGCDFLGGTEGPVASVANITITEADFGGASDVRVEVQDVAGRAYSATSHSDVSLPLALNTQFDIQSGSRDLFIVVLRDAGTGSYSSSDILGVSDAFDGDQLATSAGSSVQVGGSITADISVAAGTGTE